MLAKEVGGNCRRTAQQVRGSARPLGSPWGMCQPMAGVPGQPWLLPIGTRCFGKQRKGATWFRIGNSCSCSVFLVRSRHVTKSWSAIYETSSCALSEGVPSGVLRSLPFLVSLHRFATDSTIHHRAERPTPTRARGPRSRASQKQKCRSMLRSSWSQRHHRIRASQSSGS